LATIALTGAGIIGPATALNPFAAAGIGLAAAVFDQQVLLPFLFPPDPVVGPRINELQIGGADEGHPRNNVYGRKCRVAGSIIWSSELKETKTTDEVGGKGTGQEVENYTYSIDLALEFAVGPADGLGIEAFGRIWADAGVVYDDDVDKSISGTVISVEAIVEGYFSVSSNAFVTLQVTITLKSTSASADLSLLKSGYDAVITGFTETDYNGTFRCLSSSKSGSNSEAEFEIINTASVLGEAAGNSITVVQGTAQGVPKYDPSRMDSNPVLHLGTDVQTADSLIEATEGAGNVPGYQRSVYITIEDYQLEAHGNRVPTTWTAELIRSSTATLQDTMEDILEETDLLSSQYDCSALSAIVEKGYATRGPQTAISKLQPLMMFYNILARENNGMLVFFERKNASVKAIPLGDLSAREGQEEPQNDPAMWEKSPVLVPPRQVYVKHIDTENDYQPGEQSETHNNPGSSTESKTVDITISMNGGEARDLAATILWIAWISRDLIEVAIPPRHMDLQENDLITFTYDGTDYRFLIVGIREGVNGVSLLEATPELSSATTHSSPHEAPRGTLSSLYSAPDMKVEVIDLSSLQDQYAEMTGVFLAATTRVPDQLYKGGSIHQSTDDGVTYNPIVSPYTTQATMGVATVSLNDSTNLHSFWDPVSSVTVKLFEGTLSSKVASEVRNGANRALIGDEIVGFLSAVLEADGTYTISQFLRGLGTTEYAYGEHVDGERFILLNAVGIQFVPHSLAAVGTTRNYKAVSIGGGLTDAIARPQVLAGATVLPPDAVNLRGKRNSSSGDWTLTWRRRSRSNFTWFKTPNPPLLEDTESYEVEIMNGTTVVRTITGITSSTTPYTSAQQSTDFGGDQTTLKFRVYQISARVGRGRKAERTV